MARLLFTGLGFAHSQGYQSATQCLWSAGEIREVSEEEAAYLIAMYGREVFAPQDEPKAVRKPKTTRTRKRSSTRGTTDRK